VTWIEADVQDLPLPDATVDVALSAFGLIFAPRPEVALAQLRCWYPAAGWPHRVDRRWLYRRARTFLRAHSPSYVVAAQAAGDRAGEMFAAIERHAAPDGGPVRQEAEYLLALARL
jgi:hypothetical protein